MLLRNFTKIDIQDIICFNMLATAPTIFVEIDMSAYDLKLHSGVHSSHIHSLCWYTTLELLELHAESVCQALV